MNDKDDTAPVFTPARSPIAILGVPIDPVTSDDTVEAIATMIASRRSHYIVTANVDFVVQARDDIELRKIIFDAHLVVCDGMPLVWASRFLGNPLPERVTGSDLVPRLLAEAESRGWRVFFLGGRQESLDNAVRASRERYPDLRLVGAYSPPFKPLLELNHDEIVARITAARPDILLVAFGCPKQEKWINMHYRSLGVPVSMGVGATLAFLGGTLRRAPLWMQRTGTEWLYRLAQEPGRLGGRYSRGLWVFGQAILRQWLLLCSKRRFPGRHATAPQAVHAPRPPDPSRKPRADAAPPGTPGSLLTAPERFDAAAVEQLAPSWTAASQATDLYVDLGATRFIDSTGIGLLVRLRKRADLHRNRLVLCRCTPAVDRALELMRIHGFFQRSAGLPDTSPHPGLDPRSPPESDFHHDHSDLAITWHGEITAVNRQDFATRIEPQVASHPPGTRIEIDLSRVPFVDSSGIGLFLGLKKRAWRREVRLIFSNPSPPVRNVMRLTSLEEYLLEERRS